MAETNELQEEPVETDATAEFDQQGDAVKQEAVVMEAHEELKRALTELEKKCADLEREDKYRMAEFDNYRRRTRLEQEELRKTAAKALLVELLDVEDGFTNALTGEAPADFAAWREGIELVARKFRGILQRHGVEEIAADGADFDPALHEALFVVDEGEHAGQKVVQVLQRGYLLQDKVLRPAKVKVARGLGGKDVTDKPEEKNA